MIHIFEAERKADSQQKYVDLSPKHDDDDDDDDDESNDVAATWTIG